MLENAVAKVSAISPGISPLMRGGEEYSQSIFSGVDSREGSRVGSRVGTPRSPRELHRKKGSTSLLRMQSMRSSEGEDVPMRIRSQKSLEKEGERRESMYRPPTVENIEGDAFFTGSCTPEPPLSAGNGGETVNSRPRSLGNEGVIALNGYMKGPPPIIQEEKSRRPSTIMEDVPDCYTPTPETKGPKPKSILDPQDDELDGTTAVTKSANGKESVKSSVSPSPSPSALLRLKYPSTHHATIEIQHREGIKITTSGRGGGGSGGGSRISIQVDMDSNSSAGYTSTIRTSGKRGAMSVTVRPSSATKSEGGIATAAITPSSKHNDGNESAEDGEEELIVATPPTATKKSRPKSHHRHSHHSKSDKHRSITPPRQQSVNLIDLSGSGSRVFGGGLSPASQDGSIMTAEMWKTVRKMEKSDDLKRESALMNEGHGQGWSLLDRPISLQKRTSAPYKPMTPTPLHKQIMEAADQDEGDEMQTIISDDDQESELPDSPTLGDLPAGKKPRPLSNSNVPVEVALTMGYRGVSGSAPSVPSVPSVGVLEEPPIPGMVPVLHPGSMGMEEMAGGWI